MTRAAPGSQAGAGASSSNAPLWHDAGMVASLGFRFGVLDKGRARRLLRSLALVLLVTAVTTATGCGGGFCTAMDCVAQGIEVHVPALPLTATGGQAEVETCVADRCSQTSLSAAALTAGATVTTPVLTEPDDSSGRTTVSVRVTDLADDGVLFDDRASVRVTEFRPNGRGCPPVCLRADVVRFDG
jgi:hypothetical protein